MLSLWPLKYDKKLWTVIRLKLKAGRLNTRRVQPGFTNADYAQHIMQLKKRLPHKDFTILLQKPFVVVGDDRPALVRRRATGTVQWAVDKLKQDYFKKDPKQIIDVWLFKDKESYEKHTVALWGEKPTTPYGYYSSQHKALVMNISTGGGTLVHEIVHPFIESNFPDCPSWFNEGLASLYEQSGERGGKIVGYTNWRLAGLQKAVKGETLPKFADLCSTTRGEFYADRRARTTPRPAICVTTCSSRAGCGSFIISSSATPATIRPATRPCKKCSASATCRPFRNAGRSGL